MGKLKWETCCHRNTRTSCQTREHYRQLTNCCINLTRRNSLVSIFGPWWNTPGSIQRIQFFKSRLGPDAETSNVATRGNLQKVEACNVEQGNARDVTEGPADAVVLVVDDHWPTALDATPVPHLTYSCAETLAALHLQSGQNKNDALTSLFQTMWDDQEPNISVLNPVWSELLGKSLCRS